MNSQYILTLSIIVTFALLYMHMLLLKDLFYFMFFLSCQAVTHKQYFRLNILNI